MEQKAFSVRAILSGEAPPDAPVTVKGWVRTRRDSKAGISFVHLSDVLGEPGQPVNADPSVALFNCLYIQRAMALNTRPRLAGGTSGGVAAVCVTRNFYRARAVCHDPIMWRNGTMP